MTARRGQKRREWTVRRILFVACFTLAIAFVLTWLYLQYAERQRLSSSYTTLKPVAISRDGHSMAATFAVRTLDADKTWAARNRERIKVALQQALLEAEPEQVLAPGGLHAFQQRLLPRLNRTLSTDKVEAVVITDFLVAEGDY